MKTNKLIFFLTIGFGSIIAPGAAPGASQQFAVLDPESRITISGNVAGFPIQQQAAGSLVTSYSGTMEANVTASSIQFTGGSLIDASTNGSWKPLPGGANGSAPADYGGQANAGFASLLGAFRNVLLDVTSTNLALTNNHFDGSQLVFSFLTNSGAAFDYNAGALGSGSKKFSGLFTNGVSLTGTLMQTGGVQRITIAVDADFKFSALSSKDSTVHLNGQIVAGRVAGPSFSSISFSNSVLILQVQGEGQAVLESSTDLINWAPRTADRSASGATTTYAVQPLGILEFFRIRQ